MATETLTKIASDTVPYNNAYEANELIFDVLTLLHAAIGMTGDSLNSVPCRHGLTDPSSRMINLLMKAQDKCAAANAKLDL